MSLRATIQADLAAAFNDPNKLADAVKTFTLTHTDRGVYDPVTGTYATTAISADSRGVFEPSTEKVTDQNVRYTTTTLTVLQNELTLTPLVDDEVTIGTQVYEVSRVTPDPADATWELELEEGDDG
jgi:hypothetical protein